MELQPGEFEAYRYGAYSAAIRRVDVKAYAGRPPIYFWSVQHDGHGVTKSGHSIDLDAAMGAALDELHCWTGGEH